MAKQRLSNKVRRIVGAARGASRWRVLLWSVAGVLLILALVITIIQPAAMWTNLAAEAAGLAFTVLVVDAIVAKQNEDREKRDLILQMGSPDNASATEAVRMLRVRGWITDGSLRQANLTGANLSKVDLHEAILDNANLCGANLKRANLREAGLSKVDLTGAFLSRARLSEADLQQANLHRADLSRADLRGADLSGAYLDQAGLSGADLTKTNLSGAVLSRAVLGDWALTGPERDSYTNQAELKGADLRGAILTEAEATDEQLAQAASLKGATMPDGTVHE